MIDFQNVSKYYGEQAVLVDASFRINTGERAGIVGPNGAGKSTVFALINGELLSDGGTVTIPKSSRLGYLHQELRPQTSEVTLLEYAEGGRPDLWEMLQRIHVLEHRLKESPHASDEDLAELGDLQTRFENAGGYRVRHEAEAALSGLGFKEDDFQRPFSSFSGGWQMRAELARVTVAGPDILLMDEPSNYLDTVAIEWLQRFLRGYEGTLALISHDRYLLNSLCDVTIEVANGKTTRYAGNYDYYVGERALRSRQLAGAKMKQDRIRRQAERFIERFRAKNTKASLVQSKIKMLERMEEVETIRDITSPGEIRIPAPPHCGREVARLHDIGHTYDGSNWVHRHIELRVERGERIALVGFNGTGKTTLLRILVGQIKAADGLCKLGHKVTVGYQSQEFTETLDPNENVFQSVKRAARDRSEQEVRTLLGGFGFSGETIDKGVGILSGGEKVRVAFARLLVNPPSFLLLDEPTTHLDIPARKALEEGLREYRGTLCFVSHDIEFLRHVATSVVAMTPPGIRRYAGGYDYYRQKLAEFEAEEDRPTQAPRGDKNDRQRKRRERALVVQKYSRVRRDVKSHVDRLEKKIAGLEAEQKDLAAQLESGDHGIDYAKINSRLAEIQQSLADTNHRWEAFAIELDELEREYAAARDQID